MKIEFECDDDSGICRTPCPYGRDCMVDSMACSECIHYFGRVKDTNEIKCTGHRIKGA